MSVIMLLLQVDECGARLLLEEQACRVLQLLGRDGLYVAEHVVEVVLAAVGEEEAGKVERILLAVVGGDGQLSAQLLLGLCELRRRELPCGHAAQLALHQAQASLHVGGVAAEVNRPEARVAVAGHGALHGVYQAAPLAQGQVQARVQCRSAQHVVQQVELPPAAVGGGEGPGADHHVGLVGGTVAHDGLRGSLQRRQHGGGTVGDCRQRGGSAGQGRFEVPYEAVEVEVAIGEEHRVVWPVVRSGKAEDVAAAIAAHALSRAQDGVAQRVAAEEQVLHLVVDELGRRVFITLYLVAHHLALLLYLALRIFAAEDDVAEHVDGLTQVAARHRAVVGGLLLRGEGVQLAAHALYGIDHLQGAAAGRALEAEVLAEVGQPFLARRLVAGAGAHGNAAVDHRRAAGPVDHAEARRQYGCIVVHRGCKGTTKI